MSHAMKSDHHSQPKDLSSSWPASNQSRKQPLVLLKNSRHGFLAGVELFAGSSLRQSVTPPELLFLLT